MHQLRLALPLLLLLSLTGRIAPAVCGELSPPTAPPSITDMTRCYFADRESTSRAFRLPASAAYLDRLQANDTAWRAKLQSVDFNALDHAAKIDYLLLATELVKSQQALAGQRKRLAELEPLLGFRGTIQSLEEARWQAGPLDCTGASVRLEQLAGEVEKIRRRVGKDGKDKAAMAISPAVAIRAAGTVRDLRETLKKWYTFYDGYLPEFHWWMSKPYEEAGKQLEEYAKLLREEIGQRRGKDDDPLVGEPIGAEALAADIRCEWLPCSAEELIAVGERELAWCEGEMQRASREMGLGEDWHAALSRVKADCAHPGHQDELVAAIAREATDFVKSRKLVEVPPLCEQVWRLAMIPPEALKTTPYAAYSDQNVLVAYAREGMSSDDKLMLMRGNNRHFMRLVVPHELIPGHHLQHFYAERNRPCPFGTPFYSEGWALYWELRLWDLGWARAPEDRIGMLFWRMNRCARVILSLKFHLGRIQPAEMVEFLVRRVGNEKLGATGEVRRYISGSPLYQASYLIGGLQLRALHKELVGSNRMTESQFHEAVLRQDGLPIELLRASLLRLPLERSAKPAWRFLGQNQAEDCPDSRSAKMGLSPSPTLESFFGRSLVCPP